MGRALVVETSRRVMQSTNSSDNLTPAGPDSQFLGRLVHELRSPAHAISCFLDIYEKSTRDLKLPEDASEAIGIIERSSGDLRLLLRSLSRYAHSFDAKQIQSLSLANLVNSAWLEVQRKHADVEGARLVTDGIDIEIMADELAFANALHCIFDNTLRYRSQDRQLQVDVRADRSGQLIRLSIEDNGIGIQSEFLHKCYQPFGRLHARHLYPGAGLGIPTATNCLQHVHGQLRIESTFGSGTMVHMEFNPAVAVPNEHCASLPSDSSHDES